MRRLLATTLTLLLVVGAAPGVRAQPGAAIPALTSPVVDTTGTLRPEQRDRLQARALTLQHDTGAQLQVLVVASVGPESIEAFAGRVFAAWALGRAGHDDGVLLVVARDDRKVRIHTGRGAGVSDAMAAAIVRDDLLPAFRRGDLAGGIDHASQSLAARMDAVPAPVATGRSAGFTVLILLLAGLAGTLCALLAFALPGGVRIALAGLGALLAAGLLAGVSASAWPILAIGAVLGVVAGWLVASGQWAALLPEPALTAVDRHGRVRAGQWRADEFTYDPSAPASILRRAQRDLRHLQAQLHRHGESWSSDGDGAGGSGWSGGGGASRGGGASGSW